MRRNRSAATAPRRNCATWSDRGFGGGDWQLRQALDEAGFPSIKIVGSSGFGPAKCRIMAIAKAPLDVIGTGSFLPELWSETYATADIIAYDGKPMVKAGREFLLRKRAEG